MIDYLKGKSIAAAKRLANRVVRPFVEKMGDEELDRLIAEGIYEEVPGTEGRKLRPAPRFLGGLEMPKTYKKTIYSVDVPVKLYTLLEYVDAVDEVTRFGDPILRDDLSSADALLRAAEELGGDPEEIPFIGV